MINYKENQPSGTFKDKYIDRASIALHCVSKNIFMFLHLLFSDSHVEQIREATK